MLAEAPVRSRTVRRGWRGPQYPGEFPTLGWQVLDWTSAYLPSPREEKKPLTFTDEQALEILRWFELDPDTGEFVYTEFVDEKAKGWGKSPRAGALMLAAFCGPVCFDGWDANGEPVGVPWGTGDRPAPWVQIAAVSEDQTENTYGALYALLTVNDHKAARDLRIDDGRTRLYLRDIPGAKLEPVTASMGSREGQPITDATIDESWLWTPRNGGVKLARTIRRNLAKMGGRSVETTNAPILGERSVAEQNDPDKPAPGVLHVANRPSEEPDPSWPDERLRIELSKVYGDASWVDLDRLIREMRDPKNPWDEVLRFWFNIRTIGVARAVDPRIWDMLERPRPVPAGTPIGMGLDGSEYHDATVLRGCTPWGYTFIIGRWSRPAGATEWHVPRSEVHQAVAEAFGRYRVGRMLCDPPRWQDEIEKWTELYGEEVVIAFDTNQPTKMVPAVDRWLTAVRGSGYAIKEHGETIGPLLLPYSHDGDDFTTEQVKATRLRKVRLAEADDDRTRYMLEKDGRVGNDATVADVLAYEAAMTMPVIAEAPEPFVLVGR